MPRSFSTCNLSSSCLLDLSAFTAPKTIIIQVSLPRQLKAVLTTMYVQHKITLGHSYFLLLQHRVSDCKSLTVCQSMQNKIFQCLRIALKFGSFSSFSKKIFRLSSSEHPQATPACILIINKLTSNLEQSIGQRALSVIYVCYNTEVTYFIPSVF